MSLSASHILTGGPRDKNERLAYTSTRDQNSILGKPSNAWRPSTASRPARRRERAFLVTCRDGCAAWFEDTTGLTPFLSLSAGSRAGRVTSEKESFLLDNITKVADGQRTAGCHFDCYSIEFWVDYHGDLTRLIRNDSRTDSPRLLPALKEIGTSLGLWIDSSWEQWSVGGNPAGKARTLSNDLQYGTDWNALCRVTEPIKSMYSRAFRYHIRENGVRLLKFDNFRPLCYNPHHDHLLRGVFYRGHRQRGHRHPARSRRGEPRRFSDAVLGLSIALVAAAR